jgi:hypothetical protein
MKNVIIKPLHDVFLIDNLTYQKLSIFEHLWQNFLHDQRFQILSDGRMLFFFNGGRPEPGAARGNFFVGIQILQNSRKVVHVR